MNSSSRNPLNMDLSPPNGYAGFSFEPTGTGNLTVGSPTDVAAEMIAVCSSIVEIAQEEAEALKTFDPERTSEIIGRKVELCGRYMRIALHLRECGVAELPSDQARMLRSSVGLLQSAMADNQIALAAARAAADSVMKAIHTKLQEQAGATTSYTSRGHSSYVQSIAPSPITVNRRA